MFTERLSSLLFLNSHSRRKWSNLPSFDPKSSFHGHHLFEWILAHINKSVSRCFTLPHTWMIFNKHKYFQNGLAADKGLRLGSWNRIFFENSGNISFNFNFKTCSYTLNVLNLVLSKITPNHAIFERLKLDFGTWIDA